MNKQVLLILHSRWARLLALISLLSLISCDAAPRTFNGDLAYEDVIFQSGLGPRIPDSAAHQREVDWLQKTLIQLGWKVDIQNGSMMGHPIQNIIAKKGSGSRWVILGAHYDSRLLADQDPNSTLRTQPVPGANDGASGVAVLVELARALPDRLNTQVWLVFFDAEDNGDIPGWDWLLGSRYFVNHLIGKPDATVVVDMVGDANLNIFQEKNSNQAITNGIWSTAKELGYSSNFIPNQKFAMLDDHTPFLEAGIKAVDIIDFDYPYWHTTQDTPDKVSAQSLQAVGGTILAWLLQP
jgi:glutaminyl-peptide cyclotransferase